MSESEQYLLCLGICVEAHKGQTGKFSKEPYSNHPIRVSKNRRISSESELGCTSRCAALLHDVIEDTSMTPLDLLEAGVSKDIIYMVNLLTRSKSESYFQYIIRLSRLQGSAEYFIKLIKMADLDDNLRDLEPGSLRDKYELSKHILYESCYGEV
tara:strand:+ start:88 stop:552 length:465 start_codon:yes stop_codon:yes gene_type:complete